MRARLFAIMFFVASTAAFAQGQRGAPPVIKGPPDGVQPLPLDIFMSKNFYKDQALWMDKRYYRCNTPRELSEMWNRQRMGANPPTSASWGPTTRNTCG